MTKKENSSKAKVSEKEEKKAKEEVKQEKDFEDMTVEEQVEFLEESLEKTKDKDIKKIILDYLNNCKDKDEICELINEFIQEDDE